MFFNKITHATDHTLHFDHEIYNELNVERYDPSKSEKMLFNNPQSTNDDRFWALALAAHAAGQLVVCRPEAKTT